MILSRGSSLESKRGTGTQFATRLAAGLRHTSDESLACPFRVSRATLVRTVTTYGHRAARARPRHRRFWSLEAESSTCALGEWCRTALSLGGRQRRDRHALECPNRVGQSRV